MIDPIGEVERTGSHQVSPKSSTTYRLTAAGPRGTTTAMAVVRVVPLPPPANSAVASSGISKSLEARLTADLQDVYFDYDSSNLRDDAREYLLQDATALKTILASFPKAVIVLEGHCDERGSAEYNLALGDRRAFSAKEFLVQVGVSPNRLTFISFGKEQPQCSDDDEACWQRNRRVHFTSGQE